MIIYILLIIKIFNSLLDILYNLFNLRDLIRDYFNIEILEILFS